MLDCNLLCIAASEEDFRPMPKQSGNSDEYSASEVSSQVRESEAVQDALLNLE